MGTELVKFSNPEYQDIFNLGHVFAASGFFQDSRQAAQAVTKVLAGKELGFSPIISMCGLHIVKGKITMSAGLIAAAIKRSKKYNYKIRVLTDQECSVDFYENGELAGNSSFTMKQAVAAGLTSDTYRKFPRNMLFSRALSNGARWYCPDLLSGPVFTPDELDSSEEDRTPVTVQATVVDTPAAPISVLSKDLVSKLKQAETAVGREVFVETLKNLTSGELTAPEEVESLTVEEAERLLLILREQYKIKNAPKEVLPEVKKEAKIETSAEVKTEPPKDLKEEEPVSALPVSSVVSVVSASEKKD